MKLHANAALSLNKRGVLARRVVEMDWSLTKAAEAAEVSEPTAASGSPATWPRARRVFSTAPPPPAASTTEPPRTASRRSARCGAALHRRRDLRDPRDGRDHRLGDPHPARARPPRPDGARARAPLRALPARRARPRRRQEAGADRARHRQSDHRPSPHGTPPGPIFRRSPQQIGWEFVHVCVDDATRLAYVEVLGDERATTAAGFLRRAVRFFSRHGVAVERVLTDNGSAYRSAVHAIACRMLGIRHLRTRPYRPQTNGKAERFIRTMLGGWAYGAIYRNSARAHRRARRVALALQLRATTRLPRPQDARSPLTRAEQPARVLQLGRLAKSPYARSPAASRAAGLSGKREAGQR